MVKPDPESHDDAPENAENSSQDADASRVEPTSNARSSEDSNTRRRDREPRPPTLSRMFSVLMLLGGILIVGMLFYKVMAGFFIPLFMAAAMVVIFRPVNEWFLQRLGGRTSLASAATTTVILAIVLIPIVLLLSIGISQFTGLVARTDLDDFKRVLKRGRERFGLELEHADRFRRLQDLAGMLDQSDDPMVVLDEIKESKELVIFLDAKVEGASPTGDSSDNAIERLDAFGEVVKRMVNESASDPADDRITVEEQFHSDSVVASASIHTWMNAKLGGSFWTHAKLISNPSEKDLAAAIRSAREYLQPRFVKLSGVTGQVFFHIFFSLLIMVISIYFFFVDGPAMVRTLMRLSPLDDAYELQLLGEFEKTSRAVVLASALSALAQGVLAAIAFFLCGFDSYILLFVVTTVMALIPFLGAASVWIPCAIYLAAIDERYTAAILLAVYGAAVVSSIDNVIKAYILHGHSELHPLIALLSVLGGVPVFGPIGILIGPMVVVFLQTLLEILNHELEVRDRPGTSRGKALDDVENPPEIDVT